MKNLLNAIQNTCIAISQKEGGKYTASFFYYGQSNIVHVDVYDKNREPFQNHNVDLDSKNPTPELQKILDQLTLFYNE